MISLKSLMIINFIEELHLPCAIMAVVAEATHLDCGWQIRWWSCWVDLHRSEDGWTTWYWSRTETCDDLDRAKRLRSFQPTGDADGDPAEERRGHRRTVDWTNYDDGVTEASWSPHLGNLSPHSVDWTARWGSEENPRLLLRTKSTTRVSPGSRQTRWSRAPLRRVRSYYPQDVGERRRKLTWTGLELNGNSSRWTDVGCRSAGTYRHQPILHHYRPHRSNRCSGKEKGRRAREEGRLVVHPWWLLPITEILIAISGVSTKFRLLC